MKKVSIIATVVIAATLAIFFARDTAPVVEQDHAVSLTESGKVFESARVAYLYINDEVSSSNEDGSVTLFLLRRAQEKYVQVFDKFHDSHSVAEVTKSQLAEMRAAVDTLYVSIDSAKKGI